VAGDPRRMGPSELVRVLNSTPLGEVITQKRLQVHRDGAGLRIGSGAKIDLLRYVAWLVGQRHGPRPAVEATAESAVGGSSYQRWKEAARARSKEVFESLFATAMPRGSGKTTLAEVACIWAVLYGHRDFVALIGSDEGHAAQMLDSIKAELDGNELLLEDFPEVCYPITKLEGIANRCAGQLYQGERTQIGWTAKEVVLPMIPDSPGAGAIIKVGGITGGLRGMKFKRPDGKTARPSLVVLDDPQTDESARSPSQCETRERILAGAVLGLQEDCGDHALYGDRPRRHGRPYPGSGQTPGLERHPDQDGLCLPGKRETLGGICPDQGRRDACRGRGSGRDPVLCRPSGGDGCRCPDRLAGAFQPR
jgi:hypothetical protein